MFTGSSDSASFVFGKHNSLDFICQKSFFYLRSTEQIFYSLFEVFHFLWYVRKLPLEQKSDELTGKNPKQSFKSLRNSCFDMKTEEE